MIKINLLPFRGARRRENVRRQVNVFFLCLLFLFSLMFYFHIDSNIQMEGLETREKKSSKGTEDLRAHHP